MAIIKAMLGTDLHYNNTLARKSTFVLIARAVYTVNSNFHNELDSFKSIMILRLIRLISTFYVENNTNKKTLPNRNCILELLAAN